METKEDIMDTICRIAIPSFVARSILAIRLLLASLLLSGGSLGNFQLVNLVLATSINYGTIQRPITDMNLLMPSACQNQSVICEGSFCIPGLRRCVCDLRVPVQFGRHCLRQVDIETRCFVTKQCSHTIKDAVCIDINSNSVLDDEASNFKLEQWRQLSELRQRSQSAQQLDDATKQVSTPKFLTKRHKLIRVQARENVIFSNVRNSPYEINYNTPELLKQNHTRRKTSYGESTRFDPNLGQNEVQQRDDSNRISHRDSLSTERAPSQASTTTTSEASNIRIEVSSGPPVEVATPSSTDRLPSHDPQPTTTAAATSTSTTTITSNDFPKRKPNSKAPIWPPGVCSCPFGFMFDSMLRKCLSLSLASSHCQIDDDCKQIHLTHCARDTKKCECDEPLVWDQRKLACGRPSPTKTGWETSQIKEANLVENLFPPLNLNKLLPDQTVLLVIIVILVIVGTIIILKLTVTCFSSSGSALISPKTKRNRKTDHHQVPKSPFTTLKRSEPNSSSYTTQATRGRILNYDFEQEGPTAGTLPHSFGRKAETDTDRERTLAKLESSTLPKNNKAHKHSQKAACGQLKELSDDNLSIGQLDSESRSVTSIEAVPPPGPPPTQPPPYMLTTAMKGQGSAIAAAAAAVANRRMQMAQRNMNADQQANNAKSANGDPVFL